MLEYHGAYYHDPESGWYIAEVLDFPGAISQGKTLRSARRMLRDALREMAECLMERGKPLPIPDPKAKDKKAALVEPLRVSMRVHPSVEA